MDEQRLSRYLSMLLRHKPESIGLKMDAAGWVDVDELIEKVQKTGKYKIDRCTLEHIVETDNKSRYRFNDTKTRVKACQGHSIPWVVPELEYKTPPEFLYHGTTNQALQLILKSGHIDKMKRHAVHMQADVSKAWQSAKRWNQTPVVLKIDAAKMHEDGLVFGVSENNVWCVESVPKEYICECLYTE